MKVYEATLQYNKTLFEVSTKVINTPERAYEYLKDIVDDYPYQESCWVLLLNNKSRALFRIMITKGTLTSSLISAREVFTPALISGAASVILAHNHPSGDPTPSKEDCDITRRLIEAAKILGIRIVDHVICGRPGEHTPGFVSLREKNIVAFD